MNSKKVQTAMDSLTSFHRNHLPPNSSYQKMMEVYTELTHTLGRDYQYVKDSLNVQTVPTLRSLPYVFLDVSDAWYSKDMASILSQETNFDKLIAELNRYGFFSPFVFDAPHADSLVYDLKLKERTDSNDELQFLTHYFLHNNKLYLLPAFILSKSMSVYRLHAFDVVINQFTIEKQFGDVFGLRFGHLLSQNEIRNVVRAFHEVHATNLTVKSIKEAIVSATGWYRIDDDGFPVPDFKLQDIISHDLSLPKRNLYENKVLSPLTFLVSLPETFSNNTTASSDQGRTAVVFYLLDMVKEAQVNYFLFYDITRKETLPFQEMDEGNTKGITNVSDTPSFVSSRVGGDIYEYHYDEFNPDLDYDTVDGDFYDTLMKNTELPITDEKPIGYYTPSLSSDIGDAFLIRVTTFPYIPSGIVISGSGVSRTITVSHLNVVAAGDTIEIHRSDAIDGVYVLIEAKNRTGTSTNFTDSPNGLVYYKARARTNDAVSLFTSPVSVFVGDGPAPFYQFDAEPQLTFDDINASYDL